MNYGETCGYLRSLDSLGSVLGLDSIRELLKRLSDPHNKMKFVHIAGTNGKGSVGAFVTSVLSKAGIRAGRYLSPAVKCPLEIIQCDNRNIHSAKFADIISRIRPICDGMVSDGLHHPTRFEIETAAAFVFFAEQKCDIAVVECGMGGLLDATNVIENTECAVITPISKDHIAFLGDTDAEIAVHKAGIIKRGASVVYAAGEYDVNRVIDSKAAECGCPVTAVYQDKIQWRLDDAGALVMDYGNYSDAVIGLRGIYQTVNAALAMECLEALKARGYNIPKDAVYTGLAKTRWFGRFERLGSSPDFIIDGAHNPAGAAVLAQSLNTYYPNGGLTFIIGFFADKDYPRILEKIMPMAARIFTISTPDNPRTLSAKTLAQYIKKYYDVVGVSVTECASVKEAVNAALAYTKPEGVIVAFGSLSHLSLIDDAYHLCRLF